MMTPEAVAQKWSNNLSSATQAIAAGVDAVTVAPTMKAAARADAYVQGVQRAVADGAYVRGLQRVTLSDWQRAMKEKGIGRIGSGATAAKPKMAAFLTKFLPHIKAGLAQLENIPRGDINANITRMIAMVRHNAEFKQ